MIKRLILIIVAAVCLSAPASFSQESKKVTVLPFRINARQDLSYLETEISRLIKDYLKKEGAVIVELDTTDELSWEEAANEASEAKKIGLRRGVDYVVWGSFTRIGQKFSLDAKVINPITSEAPTAFFNGGEGIENLLFIVQDLSEDISFKLFERVRIVDILITGNKRIEADAIYRYIKTEPGDAYVASKLSSDLKAIYSMGYFEDIRIEYKDTPAGRVITFLVKEKPTIRRIEFKGNRVFDDEEISENLNIKPGSILNIYSIQNNIIRIENLYKEKNYHNVKVDYRVEELDNNQGDLEFIIEEGKKLKIRKITFEGNVQYTEKELKKIMKTNEKGFWSWLTASGELDKEQLQQDITQLRNFYYNTGFIQAKVGEPIVEYKDEMIYIKLKIDEGPKFKVGKVGVTGDLIFPEADLLEKLKISEEEFYSREIVRNDVLAMTDLYSDEGYAYADVYPRLDKDLDKLEVNIDYVVKQGKKVYFESIIIAGNSKTRDKVIRRELRVYEQELFSGKGLKRGIRNLYRLDFFEDVKVDTIEGSADDRIVLKVDVAEKPTGNFMFGGGYSSIDYGYITASIAQNNLFGRGQKLQLKTTLSQKSSNYTLSFTEPYLFDKRVSAGFDIYDMKREYDDYDKATRGGRLRLGFTVVDYTTLFWSYSYDITDITSVDEYASELIKDSRGTNVTSSTKVSLRYDSRDRMFNATEGSMNSISVEYAGIGGDIAFTKYIGSSGWYYPLFFGTTGMVHGKTGYVHENPQGFLPDYERFYLGGMNSVRGFDWRDIHAEDENGDKIGGDKFIQFNLEWIFPLIKDAGMVGVFFLDAGNVFGDDEPVVIEDTREGGGAGIRWYSPIGPLRLEYGWILDPIEGENTQGRWEFTIGGFF